jgi:hypothetical protein
MLISSLVIATVSAGSSSICDSNLEESQDLLFSDSLLFGLSKSKNLVAQVLSFIPFRSYFYLFVCQKVSTPIRLELWVRFLAA